MWGAAGISRVPVAVIRRPAAPGCGPFKLVESAQARWRAITGAHLVPLVRAGAHFENAILVERSQIAA